MCVRWATDGYEPEPDYDTEECYAPVITRRWEYEVEAEPPQLRVLDNGQRMATNDELKTVAARAIVSSEEFYRLSVRVGERGMAAYVRRLEATVKLLKRVHKQPVRDTLPEARNNGPQLSLV
jgi:hypothetical protein